MLRYGNFVLDFPSPPYHHLDHPILPHTRHILRQHGRRSLRRCHRHRSRYARKSCNASMGSDHLLTPLQARPTHVSPTMRALASRSVSAPSSMAMPTTTDHSAHSRQRAGKLHHPILRFLHLRGAPHRRGGQEPGRHEPHEHRLRRQVRPPRIARDTNDRTL